MRAYARDLNLSPSRLSEVLARKNGLSTKSAAMIAKRIDLDADEETWFCDLVAMNHARSATHRRLAEARVRTRLDRPKTTCLKGDVFRYIADWHFLALVELVGTSEFRSEPAWIAKRLGISPLVAEDAILTLKRLGIIADRDGSIQVVSEFRTTTDSIPSKAIRRFHSQMILKAERSLHSQPVEERDISGVVMSIATEDLPLARSMIQDFRRELNRVVGGSSKPKDEVYSLSIQFFRLSEKGTFL